MSWCSTPRILTLLLVMALPAMTAAEQRVALIIGNSAYPESPLRNPVRDATDVTARLGELGFDVFTATDANLGTMQKNVVSFIERIEPGATALVYYAGHGIQANGRNYLLPVDASYDTESSLRFEALEVADILDELERSESRMNLVVLDACRNNPFERKMRGGSRGLAAIDASAGSLIAYATAPGSVAADGDGENGLYTAAFLDVLGQPGLKVEEVFKQVRIQVSAASNGQQVPWESSSLTADFVFNPGDARAPVVLGEEHGAGPGTSDPPPVAAKDDICDDLSGRWLSRSVALNCDSGYTLTKIGDDTYSMQMTACNMPMLNQVTGTTIIKDRVVTTRWRGATCSGVTTITLSEDCRTGNGEATLNPSLVCTGTYAETIHFLGKQP